MISLRVTTLFLGLSLLLATVPARAEDDKFRSINDITEALNPLDVIANHDGIKRSIDLNIQFQLDSFALLPAAQRQIKALAGAINSDRLNGYGIQIVGHTDAQGNSDHNQWLSEQRATAVLLSLGLDYGVMRSRLNSFGEGESQLIEGYAEDDARHRRVEIIAVPMSTLDTKPSDEVERSSDNDVENLTGKKNIEW